MVTAAPRAGRRRGEGQEPKPSPSCVGRTQERGRGEAERMDREAAEMFGEGSFLFLLTTVDRPTELCV